MDRSGITSKPQLLPMVGQRKEKVFMSVQFQSLEGRSMFSVSLPTLPTLPVDISTLLNPSSLTSLLNTRSTKLLGTDFISKLKTDLSQISATGNVPDVSQATKFNSTINNAFADAKLTSGDDTSISVATGSLLQSQGINAKVSKSLNTDFQTILKSNMTIVQKQSFFQHFAKLETLFSQLKLG